MKPESEPDFALVAIKLLHTAVWLFLVGCILAIPIAGYRGRFSLATILSGIVLIECAVLACNRWRCPLTDLAGRHSSEHSDNFDIYSPNWLARHNKLIFGCLFVAGELFVLGRWFLTSPLR